MKVKIKEIQNILSFLLSKLEEQQGNEIELKNDFYWDIADGELYNPYEKPKEILLGQLSDDLLEISRLSKKKEEAIPYDLKRIAELLKALAIENSIAF